MSAPPRKNTKAGEGPGRFNFIGNSMIPPGEYVAAKYYDEAMVTVAAMRADIDRLLAVLATIDLVIDHRMRAAEVSRRRPTVPRPRSPLARRRAGLTAGKDRH